MTTVPWLPTMENVGRVLLIPIPPPQPQDSLPVHLFPRCLCCNFGRSLRYHNNHAAVLCFLFLSCTKLVSSGVNDLKSRFYIYFIFYVLITISEIKHSGNCWNSLLRFVDTSTIPFILTCWRTSQSCWPAGSWMWLVLGPSDQLES